jgi:hypothetical protein
MRNEAPYAWVIVGVSAVMVGMGFGAIVNMAVFLTPLATEFGWPRADLSLATRSPASAPASAESRSAISRIVFRCGAWCCAGRW